MKSLIDLHAKGDLVLTRNDILPLVSKSNEETELYNDILEDMEKQIVARVRDMGHVSITKIGSFFPNTTKLETMENSFLFRHSRDVMPLEEYREFCWQRKLARCMVKRRYRSKRMLVSRFGRFNKKLVLKYMDKYREDELSYKLSIWFLLQSKSCHSFQDYYDNVNEFNTRIYD